MTEWGGGVVNLRPEQAFAPDFEVGPSRAGALLLSTGPRSIGRAGRRVVVVPVAMVAVRRSFVRCRVR
jgi:hypothetical protein